MNDKVQYWLETAQYDLDSAKVMLDGKRYLYVGFMCHLTIEKALKAIISKDETTIPPKIHNLIRLANLCDITDNLSDDQRHFLELLNPLNIEARYPEYKNGIYATLGKTECEKLLAQTEELLLWIKQQL